MTTTLHIRHSLYLYEIVLRTSVIHRITRYTSQNQEGHSMSWDDLDQKVKEKILDKINEKDEE